MTFMSTAVLVLKIFSDGELSFNARIIKWLEKNIVMDITGMFILIALFIPVTL